MVSIREITVAVILVATSSGALAADGSVTGRVARILVDDTDFGGCMVLVSGANIRASLPACKDAWLTFDCLVGFPESSKSVAQNKLSAAQLAMVTGKDIYIEATDSRKANGYCFATRVDVIN